MDKPVDFHLLLSQTKYNQSPADVEADVGSATHDMVAQSGAGGKPKLDLLSTHSTLYYRLQVRRWSKPVDFHLLLSQTKYNQSPAAVEEDVGSATHDMVANVVLAASTNCKLDLLNTHTMLYYCL
jgi:hypothetical protein